MSKLEDYLNADISSLLAKGDYTTLRDIEKYLNKMARQRLSRLDKAGLLEHHRSKVIRATNPLDFQTTFINKYKPTNQDLKARQNDILHSISNAKNFLNKKSSRISNYKKWTYQNKKVGLKFKNENESKKFYNLFNVLSELSPNIMEKLGSKERYHVIMAISGYYSKSGLTWRESKAYKGITSTLKNAEQGTKENSIYEEYILKK